MGSGAPYFTKRKEFQMKMKRSRRLASAAASLAVFASSFTLPAATAFAADAVAGDFDNDGKFTLKDITATLNAYVNNKTLDSRTLSAVDINGDGKVNMADLTQLLRLYVNGGTESSNEIDWSKIPYADEFDFNYENADGGVAVSGYTGDLKILKIPETIAGKPVVGLNYRCLHQHNLTDVKVPSGVVYLGEECFARNIELKSVDLPDGLTSIDRAAFLRCDSLKSLTLPDTVKSIKNDEDQGPSIGTYNQNTVVKYKNKTYDKDHYYALYDTITFPENGMIISTKDYPRKQVILIDVSRALTEVVIPDGVTDINTAGFDGCVDLESVIIPEGVESIWSYDSQSGSFEGCEKLKTLALPDSLKFLEFKALSYGGYGGSVEEIYFETITFKGRTYKPNQFERLVTDVCNNT